MKVNFTIPPNINVGYNERSDTYTAKLGFVTYKDELKKELRFINSWQNWRDKNIKPDEFINEPTHGFVLNKFDNGRGWGHYDRAEFVRVYDPRGFEIEISIDNLLQIIQHNGISKGNLIEGELVYGWAPSAKKLSLIPVTSQDYKNFKKLEQDLNSFTKQEFKGKKDLEIGFKYLLKSNKIVTYLGIENVKTWSGRFEKCVIFIDDNNKTYYKNGNSFGKFAYKLEKNENINEILRNLKLDNKIGDLDYIS
jgi:hypothetical protein